MSTKKRPATWPKRQLVDFHFIEENSQGSAEYIKTVLMIFLEHTPPGIRLLRRFIFLEFDPDAIRKQAHFLKSSMSVLPIKGLYDALQEIENTAGIPGTRKKTQRLMIQIEQTFSRAERMIRSKLRSLKTRNDFYVLT